MYRHSARQAPSITLALGVITGDAIPDVTGDDTEGDMGDGTRWLTYEDMGTALGITTESAKRLAMRHKWPRQPGNDGRARVAVPEERLQEAPQAGGGDIACEATDDVILVDMDDAPGDVTGDARDDARTLIGYLERRVDELVDELADARNEVRAVRFEAETLRGQAGRADVLVALVEAERARTAEVRTEMTARLDLGQTLLEGVQAERDRLLVEVSRQRQPWYRRLVG